MSTTKKKSTVKKSAAKKAAAKKTGAKKTAAKKAAPRKTAVKKTTVKKTTANKSDHDHGELSKISAENLHAVAMDIDRQMKTFAEMNLADKNKISHRGRAVQKLVQHLKILELKND